MRRLRGDRGASAILVVVLLVPIFGMAAMSIDVGMLYYERAQLQNAADSAALAVATKCSVNECPASNDLTIASAFADGNAKDGAVAIDEQSIDKLARTVRIDVSTLNSDSTEVIRHPLAAAAGFANTETTVAATATAQWAAGDVTLPLSITTCEFDITAAGDGRAHWIKYDKNKECKGNPAEPAAKGSFGWLDLMLDDDGMPVGCVADIAADGSVGSDPGNPGLPNVPICHAVFTESLSGQTVYIPLADYKIREQGSKAVWHVKEYAKVVLHAWAFSGTPNLPQTYHETQRDALNQNCTGNCRGVMVEFKGYVPLGTVPGTDISTTVSLID